jgi:uncharacterized protein YciI
MKALTLAALACALALGGGVASAQDEMMAYQMVLFRRGPSAAAAPADARRFEDAHAANLKALNAQRVCVAYGPFGDAGDLRGVAILDVPSADAARARFADDPLVKGGHLALEVHPWWGPKGWFRPPTTPPAQESLIFGFLVRGPNTAQPPAEAEALQKGHLAYMEEIFNQGKLVAAGPFGDNTALRGIVVYRVKNGIDEARQLAAGDPAVKAGRLVIDAHPWTLPAGILK